MFIAHLPASYICTHCILKLAKINNYPAGKLYLLGMLAGIAPDLDLLYFYLFDGRQHHHHSYITHIPFFWLMLFTISVGVAYIYKNKTLLLVTILIVSNALLHLILDTPLGSIRWLYPVSTDSFQLLDIPARYSWWPLNFILHWTFLVEIIVLLLAVHCYKKHHGGLNERAT